MSSTNAAADVRQMIEDVKARHREVPGWIDDEDHQHYECSSCGCEWPCDAIQLARRLEQAVTALEWYGDTANYWQNFMDLDGGDRARAALRRMAGGE